MPSKGKRNVRRSGPSPGSAAPAHRAPALPWVAGIVLLGAALRFLRIGERGLWLDEAVSWLFASGSPGSVVEWLRLDSGPPLYYWLLWGWMRLFGDSEMALRGLSALLGAVLVAVVYAAGARLLGRRVGLAAALVTALLPIQVRYAQEARGYTLVPLLGLVAMSALARWVEGGKGRWLALQVAAFLALLYCHNYGFFLLAAGGLFAAWQGLARGRLGRSLAGFPLIVLGYLPWLPVFLAQLGNSGPYAWMGLAWEEGGMAGALLDSLRSLSPGGEPPPYVGLAGLPAFGGLAVLLAGLLAAAGLVVCFRRWRGADHREATFPWLTTYLLVPLSAAAVYSAWFDPIYLPGRLDQLVVPAFCLLVAAGIDALRPAALRYGVLAAWAGLSLATLVGYYRGEEEPPAERAMAAVIARNLEPGHAVLATSLTRAPLAYYLRHRPRGVPLLSFPPEIARHPGNEDLAALAAEPAALERQAGEALAEITAAGPRRLYLAFVPNPVNARLLERLAQDPRLRRVRELGRFRQRLLGREVTLLEIPVG